MTSKEQTLKAIDDAIARIDAKLAAGADRDDELRDERRELHRAQSEIRDSESPEGAKDDLY